MNRPADWRIVNELLWYRVPVETAPKRWPPQWLGFYHTKPFGDDAHTVRYFGQVVNIRRVRRPELFPDESPNEKSNKEYFQLFLDRLLRRPEPIVSYRLRRIVFIATTWHKFIEATEINDLWDDSPLEDMVWSEMKKLQMRAERQVYIECGRKKYCLDFDLLCRDGKVNIETDGDRWHINKERAPLDNVRDNCLTSMGYRVLRFNRLQVRDQMAEYCVPRIVDTVQHLGGIDNPNGPPITYKTTEGGIAQQFSLFDP